MRSTITSPKKHQIQSAKLLVSFSLFFTLCKKRDGSSIFFSIFRFRWFFHSYNESIHSKKEVFYCVKWKWKFLKKNKWRKSTKHEMDNDNPVLVRAIENKSFNCVVKTERIRSMLFRFDIWQFGEGWKNQRKRRIRKSQLFVLVLRFYFVYLCMF